jgi:ABC-type Mn2+/Zn2+ transport system permease subunit
LQRYLGLSALLRRKETCFRRLLLGCLVLAALASLVSVVGGILAAFLFDLPASATIVLMSFVIFSVGFVWRRMRGRA